MGDEYWLETQASLQGDDPLFSKPKLAENLLKKPPFRFIHDIVSAIQKSTGFAPGLFTEGEKDSKAVAADKELKNVYLSKIIQLVSLVLGESVKAKPPKIMAGVEPEHTNAFLLQLARAARQTQNTDQGASFVTQVIGTGVEPAAPPPPEPAAPRQKEPPPQQEAPPAGGDDPNLGRSSSRKGERSGSRGDSRERKDSSRSREDKERERKDRKEKERRERKEKEMSSRELDPREESPERPGQKSMGGPMRPQSARRGPPKAGTRPQDALPQESLVPAEGPKLFVEGDDGDDDEVEVVTEQEPLFGPIGGSADDGEGQGALVKDILDAQKQLAQEEKPTEDDAGGPGTGTGIVLKRRSSSVGKSQAPAVGQAGRAADLNALRTSIQTLCQSAMPLGKSMDYLQEDLENMKKELKFWMNEYKMYQARLAEAQRYTEDLLNPQATLSDVDNQIRQAKDRIKGMKSQVLRNDETIQKLLGMVVSGNR